MSTQNNEILLEVKDLKKHFYKKSGFFGLDKQVIQAVNGISFSIKKGETFGLVGESGCGKSTTGRTLLRLYDATAGQVIFDGKDVMTLNKNNLKDLRKDMQMIFQDPYASLNGRMTVEDIIGEALDIHNIASGEKRKQIIFELLERVGLKKDHAARYPHEFSGGQRQRIGIARALAVRPKFIICDEPISALDVSIQAQVVNMLEDLQKEFGLTYLFIAHDLSMVKYISDRIGVMYLGSMMEIAASDKLYDTPLHPYTRSLLSAVPIPDPKLNAEVKREILSGDIPSPINLPSGCSFRTRCKYAKELCAEKTPELLEVEPEHFVACHFVKELSGGQ